MKAVGKFVLCYLACLASMAILEPLQRVWQLPMPEMPTGLDARLQVWLSAASGLILIAGLVPMAMRLGGKLHERMGAWFFFLMFSLGLNTTLEASIFTGFASRGVNGLLAYYLSLSLLVGAAMGWGYRTQQNAGSLLPRTPMQWIRGVLPSWLLWPVIYILFGAMVAPIVLPYYLSHFASLKLPTLQAILAMQLLRGALFLVSALPLIALYQGSRKQLWWRLGLAHATITGIYPLASASFYPAVMRLAHGTEITLDSFAYAGVLVWLLTKREAPSAPCVEAETTSQIA